MELVYGDLSYDFYQGLIDIYEDRGYDCKSDGAIRNAFGKDIGTRYKCTGCKNN